MPYAIGTPSPRRGALYADAQRIDLREIDLSAALAPEPAASAPPASAPPALSWGRLRGAFAAVTSWLRGPSEAEEAAGSTQ